MTTVNNLVQGLLLGGLYALFATGLSVMFGVMRLVNLAHGDLAVCGAYLALVFSSALGVPAWWTLPLLLPLAFGAGVVLQLSVLGRALRGGDLAPVLVTFGLSVVIENLLLVGAGAVLVGAGLMLVRTPPRADAPDIGSPVATVGGSASGAPSPPPPAAMPPPVTVALPGTPGPVPLVPVGVLPTGALQLPEQPTVLGWYAVGAVPGAPAGTAVIAGHVDSARYGAGPLRELLDARQGDLVEVTDTAGGQHRYSVASRTTIRKPGLPPELFRVDGPPRLALITCGGAFDRRTGNYADNVVVLAEPVP
jgi:hypothetical protein